MKIREDLFREKSLPFYRRWGRELKRVVVRRWRFLKLDFTVGFGGKMTIAG